MRVRALVAAALAFAAQAEAQRTVTYKPAEKDLKFVYATVPAVATLEPGDILETNTFDAFGNVIKKPGDTMEGLGQKIFGDNVTNRSDVGNQILRQTPVGPEGLAARPITWIEKGVVKNLFYDRYWAKQQNKLFTPTNPNQSLVMDGGDASVDQMVKATKRGLLITFFWYIRPVE